MINLLSKKAQMNVNESISVYEMLQPEFLNNDYLTATDKRKLKKIRQAFNNYQVDKVKQLQITSSSAIGKYLANRMHGEKQEILLLLSLDTKNKVIEIDEIFKGSLNSSVAHPREIYKKAISHSAASIIVAHNHPSGDTEPSEADISFTRRIVEAGELLGIKCLDHFILGDSYLSLREHGLM